ncbi:MAG: hypothetical protein DPW11_02775 [bacterium]|nr:hypothetical protein [bacterium]
MGDSRRYAWRRYWSPPEGRISLTDGGFLNDPSEKFGKFINPDLVELSTPDDTGCLVMLGEPGIGKSVEMENLFQTTLTKQGADHVLLIDLRNIPTPEIFRDELAGDVRYQNWMTNGEPLYLFLDSFDEGMTSSSFKSFAKYFYHLLSQHQDKLSKLYLRVSCRTALWQSYFEDDLRLLWSSGDTFRKYELCPLIKSDVENALDARGIDKEQFLKELRAKEVVGLAGKPLTLNLLMDVYQRDGQFPEMKSQIYSQGCELLIQEQDPAKRNDPTTKPTLTLAQKIAIAERIAAATVIGGKPTISIDGDLGEGEIGLSQLHGTEYVSEVPVAVGDQQVLEVLNTGLFSSRGNGKMGWAHQTYGEFLAARYIVRHKLDWQQTQSMLFHDSLKIGTFQVVPQLYEVSAWLASIDPSFFDNAVPLDPEFLLLSDANVITDSQKQSLTGRLLAKLDKGELFDRWEIYNATNYKKLSYPDLGEQLKPYITDSTKGVVVRRAATEIASACAVTDLEDALVKVALTESDDLSVRVRAVMAIANFGSDKSRQSLKPLITSGFQSDPEDELKGVVLRALWPKHISIDEVLSLLTPPKKRSFHGAYHGFMGEDLALSLRTEDVIPGLEWIEKNVEKARDLEYSQRKLADAIMFKAWEHASTPGVLEKFASIAYDRLKEYEEVIGERALNEEVATKFQKMLDDQAEDRQKLIKELIHLTLKNDTSSGRKGYILLHHNNVRIVSPQDVPWLVNWLLSENDEETQKVVSEVIMRVMDVRNPEQIDLVFHAREKNKYLKEDTYFWFQTVELASESAKTQREQWEEQQSWQTRAQKDEKEEILKALSLERIADLLKKVETGDVDAWWQLHNNLCMYRHELEEDDIRELPGWKILNEEQQKKLIEYGKPYLEKMESKPEMWLGQGKIYYPALAGYRAIKAFYREEPQYIEGQGVDFWKRWSPITLGFPLVSNDPENGKIIALAYKHAPEEVISTLDVLIDDEAQRHNGLFINDLLEDSLDPRLSEFLLGKAKQEGFSPKAAGEIVRFLLSHGDPATKEYVKSQIEIPLPSDEEKKNEVLSAAASLMWNADLNDWKFLWDLMQKDNDFARALVVRANDSPLRGSTVLQSMSESLLADLYVWLTKEFPPEEYSRPEGVHTVTPQISIGDWRDSTLRVLMDKGTPEACRQIERVAAIFPQHKWLQQYTLVETRRIALQKTWNPPAVDQIFKLVENHELRLVNSPDELMDIVIASLKRLEGKLQRGEHPQAINLWNEKRPKDENRLSDYVKVHLEEDLKSRGIIVNREVEIKRGNKTDIHISVYGRDHLGRPTGEPMKVTIETKGCWHPELDAAMESQLVGQYLSTDVCRHGIYLIGWFVCDAWSDRKNQKIPSADIAEEKKQFANKAEELSKNSFYRIESFILDARI